MQGAQVPSLVGELRSHMPCSVAKKTQKTKYRNTSYLIELAQVDPVSNVGTQFMTFDPMIFGAGS